MCPLKWEEGGLPPECACRENHTGSRTGHLRVHGSPVNALFVAEKTAAGCGLSLASLGYCSFPPTAFVHVLLDFYLLFNIFGVSSIVTFLSLFPFSLCLLSPWSYSLFPTENHHVAQASLNSILSVSCLSSGVTERQHQGLLATAIIIIFVSLYKTSFG